MLMLMLTLMLMLMRMLMLAFMPDDKAIRRSESKKGEAWCWTQKHPEGKMSDDEACQMFDDEKRQTERKQKELPRKQEAGSRKQKEPPRKRKERGSELDAGRL